MLASWGAWVTFTRSLAPTAREARVLDEAEKLGLKASAAQLPTWKRLATMSRAPSVEVSVVVVSSLPQLLGLNRNRGRLTSTLMLRSRSGTPLKIVGRALV